MEEWKKRFSLWLQLTTYNSVATPFHERAVQPLVTRPTSPQVVSVAGIMQLLHCARQLSRKTVSAWMAWVSKGQRGAKEGFPCRFTTEISPYVSFLVLIHSMLDDDKSETILNRILKIKSDQVLLNIRINCVKYDIFYIVHILEMESWNYSSENSVGLFVNSFRFRVRSVSQDSQGKVCFSCNISQSNWRIVRLPGI